MTQIRDLRHRIGMQRAFERRAKGTGGDRDFEF
jgi:hypothetical protein